VPARIPSRPARPILDRWYRDRLRELIPPLIEEWSLKSGLGMVEWRLRRYEEEVGIL